MARLTIFLDDGGVMNDNAVRAPQWQHLVGEYLAPRLGGEPKAWGEANSLVAQRLWDEFAERFRSDAVSYRVFWADFLTRWLREMCDYVGIDAPDEPACVTLANETSAYATPRVRSAYPDAVETILEIHRSGHALHTASGEPSDHLDGYLAGMGVRHCFGDALYGPDVIDTPKEQDHYYSRIFAHAGVEPTMALVVDDSEQALDAAAVAGASTLLVARNGRPASRRHRTAANLAELPGLLQSVLAEGAA
jgi:phosphoglycolate phosphatase-like HAD superfamily hydrolase